MGKAKHPHDKERPESAAVRRALKRQDIAALKIALTPRQRRFAEEYIVDLNGTAAAIRAGYSNNYPDRQAHILLKHEGVAALIDHLMASKAARIVSVDPDYVIQRITAIINKDTARDGDKLRGLELLARHLGMLTDKQEITGKDGGAIEIQQKTAEDVATFLNSLKGLQKRAEEKKTVELVDA